MSNLNKYKGHKMVEYNRKISTKAEKEQRFYPDDSEIYWAYLVYTTGIIGVGLLLFMALHSESGNKILFLLFCGLLVYILYIGYFIWKSPKLYIDKEQTYLRVRYSKKDEIIYLNDIENYDYFNCYTNPLRYPYLCLCVQIFLHNGNNVEFFAFMKGAQRIIEDKMFRLGIIKRSL